MLKKSKRAVIISVICTVCIVLAAALLCMAWLGFRRNNPNRSLYGRTVTLSGEMSPQERSGDFSELCSFIEMNAPIVNFTLKNSFEELYGISYQSIKDHYGRLVQNAETDFAYYACLTGFLNNIPSAHMRTGFPGGRLADGNMERWLSENQSFTDAQSYWLEVLRSECRKCYDAAPEKMVFSYYSGSYVGAALTDGDKFGVNRAVLLSVNGIPADEFIKLFSSSYKLKYDHAAGKPFRDSVLFNDSFGEPCEIEYRTADGETRTAELYCGAEAELCLNYTEYFKAIDGTVQPQNGEAPAQGRSAVSVLRDGENGIAVIFADSFNSETVTGEVIANTIKNVSADFDNIVIDLRNNSGGEKNGTVRLGFCTGSGIYFYYTEYTSLNPDGTDNCVYGTAPDILLNADPESYFIRERLRRNGEDIYSLENRLEWDSVLRQVFELMSE